MLQSYFEDSIETVHFSNPTAAVAVEIEMPTSKHASEKAMKDFEAYLLNAFKRRAAIEVNEKHLTTEELNEFRGAKGIEVKNFVAAKAFEALPPHLRPSRDQAIHMRWILTWKRKDDGTKKAKARAVLLGYQDPHYEHRATTSPTTTRQTRQLQMQVAASLGFKARKGDVTGAFLQSRPYPGELYCIPCPEICEAMGLEAGSITRVRKACYGLVDAPLEWYRSISTFFSALGLRRCWSDPCSWIYMNGGCLKGMISGHVDDFIFTGDETDQGWNQVIAAIQKEYKWSDWEDGSFTQCGVQVVQQPDFSFTLSQPQYVDGLKFINLRAHRKKDRHAPTDEVEKSQLRTLLGGISWHAQQVAPQFAADVGLLLPEVNHSTVDSVLRANQLLDAVREARNHSLKIKPIPIDKLILVAWVDAGNQNRCDGYSTQGILIGASHKDLLKGDSADVSLIAWHSQKISRVCRSPGASEAAAAVNGEDALFFCRFQLSELLGHVVNVRATDNVVNQIPGCVVTDSRNVYDKLETEVLSVKGAEKRTDITLLGMKEAQIRNQVIVRWVHSEAQLANGLTKPKEYKQFHMFFDMNQRWKIVEDAEKDSARKRKAKGLGPLEDRTASQTGTPNDP